MLLCCTCLICFCGTGCNHPTLVQFVHAAATYGSKSIGLIYYFKEYQTKMSACGKYWPKANLFWNQR